MNIMIINFMFTISKVYVPVVTLSKKITEICRKFEGRIQKNMSSNKYRSEPTNIEQT